MHNRKSIADLETIRQDKWKAALVILAIIVIGGLRSIYGTFVGAIIAYALPDLVLKRIPVIGDMNGVAYVFSGILIILVVLFYPSGVVNVFTDVKKLILKAAGKEKKEVTDHAGN